MGEAELAAIAEVFQSGWLAGAGPTCRRFEERFAAAAGTAHALTTSSCGAALHLALLAAGVRPGDEVVVADFTFPATGHAVLWAGATPVFADALPDTFTVDPAAVEAAITARTTGIIAVDVAGLPADYDELRAIAGKHGLFLIEDAACAAGASYRGRPAGSLADVAAFSFHGRKGITSGEGGAITSDDADLVAAARKLHNYGIEPAISREGTHELPVPSVDELGYNYRLSDVQAAIMNVQLDRLPQLLAARRHVATRYGELLKDLDGVCIPVEPDGREHPWQSYLLMIDASLGRDKVALGLRERGVQCTFGTYASHLQPLYGTTTDCPISRDIFRRSLAIPMHANLTGAEIERVAETLTDVVTSLS
ncbi:MAG: aminotransferase class I/II-fold pyridoxal phosphate-dependent enzyme [Pseudonocardiaceae bacterium]|nr:aminotransferase class I/II-fold pyridoxal phosphate-dependent enzyme [Pseudonocardiaceae bacterium]